MTTWVGAMLLSARSAVQRFFRYAIARWADHAVCVAFHGVPLLVRQDIGAVMLRLAKHQVVRPNHSIVMAMLAE